MTARILPFPNFSRPATPRDEVGVIIILPIVRIERECPKIALLRRQSKQWLREHFKRELSGGEG